MNVQPTTLAGTVVHGDGRGHGLGFPTANLHVPHVGCPDGVYAAWARVADEPLWREATVSIGDNPTFGDVTDTRVECHIHDFSGDLYGTHATVVLVSLIRDMRSFEDVAGLIERTAADLVVSRRLLAAAPPPGIHHAPAAHPDSD
ncbi:riboflavin kinase [Microbacterium esteraromaticum]|nr:riboflavin kinase [Microbacterium esteraromaticum]MBN8424738.1 riboflavin kinase [Microbacterium esteraromaticum]